MFVNEIHCADSVDFVADCDRQLRVDYVFRLPKIFDELENDGAKKINLKKIQINKFKFNSLDNLHFFHFHSMKRIPNYLANLH